MCIIVVKKTGIDLPKKEWLENCDNNNSDGIGIMYHKPNSDEIVIKKDFANVKALINFLQTDIKKEDILVIHFRLATHGRTDIGNRHPFPLTTEKSLLRQPNLICRYALAHNGVLMQFQRHEKFSDTQKFVLNIMADEYIKENLGKKSIDTLLTNFLGNDKLAIMKYDGTLYLYGEYVEDEGLYFSNNTYKFKHTYSNKYQTGFQGIKWNDSAKQYQNHSFKDVCEHCKKERFVKYIEAEIEGQEIGLFLCKECRKKAKKKTKLPATANSQCMNCFEWFNLSQLQKTTYGLLCRKCRTEQQLDYYQ